MNSIHEFHHIKKSKTLFDENQAITSLTNILREKDLIVLNKEELDVLKQKYNYYPVVF